MKANVVIPVCLIIFWGCSSTKNVVYQKPQEIKIIAESTESEITDLGNGWFEVIGQSFIQNITPEEARGRAILDACKKAIEYHSGVEISGRSLDIQAESQGKILLDNFSSLSSQVTTGIILEKKLIHEEIKSDGNILVKVVVLKVKVGKQKGEKDPYFTIEPSLNREYFKDGEEIELSVKSSKDCYLTVLNICSNDSVYVIFPNEFRSDSFLRAGEQFNLPNKYEKEIGLTFPVGLLPGKDEDVEMLKILVTKEKIDFSSVYSFSAYGTCQSALKDLQKWLIKIPRSEVEEVDLIYYITR